MSTKKKSIEPPKVNFKKSVLKVGDEICRPVGMDDCSFRLFLQNGLERAVRIARLRRQALKELMEAGVWGRDEY